MSDEYEILFQCLGQIDPPKRLSKIILTQIAIKEKHAMLVRLCFAVAASAVSFVAMIPAFMYMFAEFYQSNFYTYVLLLFSDGSTTLLYWKEFVLSLAESLPLVGITLVLTTIFVFLGSLRLMARYRRTVFLPAQFI